MNYILIQNDGEVDINSFELIGASTKRGNSTKIGFFGSGLKYSIAYMMRNNISFRIFSGEKEITFSTKNEVLREQTFKRICINEVPTSYTTTMGPTWTEDWFVVREIYCNALDEIGCQIINKTDIVQSIAGKTRIYIELTKKLQQVVDNWDRYFTDDRTPLFTVEDVYSGYLADKTRQTVKVYSKTEGSIYRKGIKVSQLRDLIFDYELEEININEDRTASNPHGIQYIITDMIYRFSNEHYVKEILLTAPKSCWEFDCTNGNSPTSTISEKWVKFSQDNLLVISDYAGRYEDQIRSSKIPVYQIPSTIAKYIKRALPEFNCLGVGGFAGDVIFDTVEASDKNKFLLKAVITSLEEMKYHINYDIEIVNFQNDSYLGYAHEGKIYISSKTFNLGRREIAMTLIEENEHLISGFGDKTREFQNHIFSKLLQYMEDSNGLFL